MINPKEMRDIFTDDVLDILPSNDKLGYLKAAYEKAQDPTWREKMQTALKNTTKTEEWRSKHKLQIEKLKENTIWRENVTQANREKSKTSEWQENNLIGAEKRKNNPNWRENVTQANKRKANDLEIKLKLSNALKGKKKERNPWDDPEYAAKQLAIMNDPEFKKKKSAAGKLAQGKLETRMKHAKPIMTSEGEFYGRGVAGEHFSKIWNCSQYTACQRILKLLKDPDNKEFYYINKE